MKIVLTLLLVIVSTLGIRAQEREIEREALAMKIQFSLTDQQYSQLLTVFSEHSALLDQLQNTSAAWESNQHYKDSIDSIMTEKIRGILSEEQFSLWTQQQGENSYVYIDRKQAEEEASEMKQILKLNEEQTKAFEDLTFMHLQFIRKEEAVQRGSGQLQPRIFLRAKSEYRDGVSEIFSKEQFEKWKKLEPSN